jgi:hypothetical protein
MAVCCALLMMTWQRTLFKTARTKIVEYKRITAIQKEILPHVQKLEKHAQVVMSGYSTTFFSYYLGEQSSLKALQFREVGSNRRRLAVVDSGVAVYIKNDMGGPEDQFMFLAKPREYLGEEFHFYPRIIARDTAYAIYWFKREIPRKTP